jgi:hypothetical protein
VLATTLLVMMTNDTCIKAQRILSNDNKPSAEEARTKVCERPFKSVLFRVVYAEAMKTEAHAPHPSLPYLYPNSKSYY